MAVNIGPKIGIEGEAEYRKQINSIIQQSKTLSSEMKALTTSFDKNGKSLADNAKQHQLLQKQIANQETKLKQLSSMLQQSKEKFGENAQQTQKWQQAVNEAQAELNQLKSQLDSLPSSLDIISAKMATMGEKLESVGNKIASVGSKLTSTVTTGIVGAFTAAVKTTGNFDAAMSKVQAVSGATADQLELLRQKAKEMGETTKFSASESAEALNYMAMAGWQPEQMLQGLAGIMNLAAASGEELSTTSDIVTDALTAFNMTADQSGRFADILAAAASNANTNVAMMGESFKYVAPVAGALGYTAEDVAVALGLMANAGIKADMAGTSLRNMLNRMAKPTKESAAAMERLGIELYDGEGEMFTFREIMDQLRVSMKNINIPIEDYEKALDALDAQLEDGTLTQKKYEEALEELNLQTFGAEGAEKARAAAMLGGTRAMSGLLAIANASEEDYARLTSAIDDSSQAFAKLADGSVMPLNEALKSGQEIIEQYNGSAEAMAATMLDNLPGQMTILKSQIEGLAISIGELLMPTIRSIVTRIQEFVDKLNNMDDAQKKQLIKIAAIVAAIGPLLLVGGKLLAGVGKLMKLAPMISSAIQGASAAFGGVGASAGAALAPIAAVVAAIGVLVAAFMNLWKNNEQFRSGMTETWNSIKESFSGFIAQIQERLPAIQEAFSNIMAVVGPMWDKFCNLLGPTFQAAFDFIKIVLDGILNAIIGVIDMLTGIFTGNKELFMQGLMTFLQSIWDFIVNWFLLFNEWIINTINVFLGWFDTSLGELISTVFDFLKEIWDGITEKVGELVEWVIEKITEICDFIASLPERFYQWGVDMIQGLIDGIRSMIGAVGEAISDVANTIAEFLHFSEPDKGPLSNFNSWMPDMMKQMAEQIEAGRYQVKVAAANVAADIAAPMAGARNVTLNNNFTFGGGYTEADGRSIVRQINRQLGALYI